MDNNYSWVNTHKGIVQYLSNKEKSQQELIDLLKQLGITGFNDQTKRDVYDIELSEIDPFTFFCFIHKFGDIKRLKYLQQIAQKLDLETPLDVEGIPTQAQKVWLFPFKYLRKDNEISRLWSFFKKELKGEITDEDFADVLRIRNVGLTKLTEALFYINPEKYLPINGPTKPYIKEVLGLDYQFSTYSEYTKLLEKIREKTDVPFYELSHEAWVWNKENTSDDPIRVMIEEYKKHIAKTQLKDEVYKWKFLTQFKDRPNIDAENLHEEIKSINYSNLMYHLSKAVINDLTEKKPEETRKLFEMLFDESVDLAKRIKDFSKSTKELYRALGETNQHHQDERAISTYLTYKYPENYSFYKYSFYKYYCELLGVAKAKKNERYTHYLSLIDELIEQYIAPDDELIEQVEGYLPELYDGVNHKLLAQDILFQMERRNAKENYWVFQGNPDKYDFEAAFKEDDIHAWTVTSHKASIKEGDKVIIWITGSKAGCYALADVVSDPMDRESFADSDLWKEEDTSELKAAINITHNLANNPILKDEIDKIKELDNLKVGSQGTNFSATKQEYETLLEIAMKKNEEKRYWLYSPGEQAKDWEEFYNNKIMGLAWDKLDDLKKYKSKDEIKEALDKAYGGDGSKKNNTTANDEFANVMKVGDVVIAKKGSTELLGYGVVVSDYIYDEDRDAYKHLRRVDWKLEGNWDVGSRLVQKTLTDITYSPSKDPNYDTFYESLLGIMGVDENGGDDSQFLEIKNKFDLEYGYELFENFIKNLRKIVSELNLKPNDERVVYTVRHNRFNFIIGQRYCFNIHLKYPDGVYGFISSEKLDDNSNPFKGKPEAYYNYLHKFNLTAKEWSSLIDTMRRELEKVAKAGFLKHNNADFENYVFQGIANGEPMIPSNTILYGPPGTGKTYNTVNEALRIIDNIFLEENNDNRKALNERFRSLRFNPENGEGQIAFITFHQSLSYEDFIEGIKPVKSENNDDVKYEVCPGIFKSIAKVAGKKRVDLSFDENYEQFTNYVMEQGAFSLETPVQKKPFKVRINGSGNCVAIPQTETATEMVIAKEWIEEYLQDGTVRDWKPYLSSIANYISANYNNEVKQVDNTTKSYVIIIDEINRGNISQIFGELITLIEPDKRKGQAEEIEVILPYSKERFSVPSNLHIIGTMNTADRSVEALDTALRRRFSFMEMNPAPWLLNSEEFRCEGIDLSAMLEAINGRIEKLLDKDYCIGHSYFMTIKNKQKPLEELKYIFQNKILPLLQEYFYGDWGKIRLIVGKEFVEMKKSEVAFLDEGSVDDYEEFDERPIYNFTNCEGWTLESFKTIYEQA